MERIKNIRKAGEGTKCQGIKKGLWGISNNKRKKMKQAGILCAAHRLGICAVNFYAEMPCQTEKELVGLPHPIVDKNPRQMHQDPELDCSRSLIYIP